ncbi:MULTISPECIES: acyltransferase [Bacillaceae]|uniref:Acetyltransferase n=1 Tax=Gottfriedia luciferensis TaxID=178774 RepID=A0ABX2ZP82_9BACI|nr:MULTISPECIES: acyltransferase [Bacillaceae]ODG90535.1 acetyltransferase [Gottfriedia luciferensis]PGZ94242.1 acetyltransferase [Bacillus sp. AFS029533]
MRKTKRYLIEGENSLWQVYKTVSFWKTFRNTIVIEIARYIPFFRLKNWLYRNLIGMKVGEYTSFAFKVTPDLMFPELISVGRNSIIGYNTTILAHEYLINEYRLGEVIIGNNVLVGANTTVLPGVTIGDGAKVSAATLVNKDVPAGAFVGGNPMVIISLPQSETTI